MKKLASFLVFLLAAFSSAAGSTEDSLLQTTVQGIYSGKNMYVQNPVSSSGTGFCIHAVSVNGISDTAKIQSSAFEIDLPSFNVKKGDSVTIIFFHEAGCRPKILNTMTCVSPYAQFGKMRIDSADVLHFSCSDENGFLTYFIWQFRWNKWVKIGELAASGNPKQHEYLFDTKPFLFNGENRFRVTIPYANSSTISETVSVEKKLPAVSFTQENGSRVISFSAETMFELYDRSGNLVRKGSGRELDCSGLETKHSYWLNYDNRSEKVFLKKQE